MAEQDDNIEERIIDKEIIEETNDAPKEKQNLLVPETVVKSSLHPDLTLPQNSAFRVPPGEVHLIELDANGNEVSGSDFTIGFATYQKAFQNITAEPNKVLVGAKFLLKKNNPK